MGFKEELDREKNALLTSKRPYETAAFIVFLVLFVQQFGILILRIVNFIKDSKGAATGWFSTNGLTTPAFFSRIVLLDSSKHTYVFIAIAALILWYFLIYLLVWNYCKKRNKAKWTWTLMIVFGPTILFMPPYIIYAIYVFRSYFFRFIKTVVEEYKEFDPKAFMKEEKAIVLQEDEEAEERARLRDNKQRDKELAKEEKAKEKEEKNDKKEDEIEK